MSESGVRWAFGRGHGRCHWHTFLYVRTRAHAPTCTHVPSGTTSKQSTEWESRRHHPSPIAHHHPGRIGSDQGRYLGRRQDPLAGGSFWVVPMAGPGCTAFAGRPAGSPEHFPPGPRDEISSEWGWSDAVCSGSGSRLLELFFGPALVQSHPTGKLRGCKAA